MDPNMHMMPDGSMMPGAQMQMPPAGPMPPGGGMPMPPGGMPQMGGPMDEGPGDIHTGPMALMNQPEMKWGGDSLMALAEYADDPDVAELLRKQDEERRSIIDTMHKESAMAAEALLNRMRMHGESIDTPGGPVNGLM